MLQREGSGSIAEFSVDVVKLVSLGVVMIREKLDVGHM